MTATGHPDTMAEAVALIDQLIGEAAQSKLTITALMGELARLRRQVADRDGLIGDLHSRIAALAGGFR